MSAILPREVLLQRKTGSSPKEAVFEHVEEVLHLNLEKPAAFKTQALISAEVSLSVQAWLTRARGSKFADG